MSDRILFVDDDPNILHAYQRALRKRFQIDTALGPEEALETLSRDGPYALIIADMRMPGMNGVELLARVKQIEPDTVRVMLTGNADQQTALDAVNEGAIFRFLTKPCDPEVLAKTVEAAVRQYQLVTSERDLLSKTLSGSVKMLTDVLALVNPTAFGRAARVRRIAADIARQMQLGDAWQIEVAAMLSQIGCVAVPEETLTRFHRGEPLNHDDKELLATHPAVGAKLLTAIPRLETVAEIIAHQNHRCDDGDPTGENAGGDLPLGSRILKVALDFDDLLSTDVPAEMAIALLNDRPRWYDRAVLAALRDLLVIAEIQVVRRVSIPDMIDGMVLADDVFSLRGTLLCARGQEVTPSMRVRLRNYVASVGVQEAIKVLMPAAKAEAMNVSCRSVS